MSDNLVEGRPAPAFDLPTDGGGHVSLDSLRGQAVVLYFYPKDDTSGCTSEAQAFTALSAEFDEAGAVVVGVSPDSTKSHAKFRAKYDLGVRLASDESKETLERYGLWVEKSMYGRKYMGVERTTVLLDGQGIVRHVWRKVRVPGHAEEVLKAAQQLSG